MRRRRNEDGVAAEVKTEKHETVTPVNLGPDVKPAMQKAAENRAAKRQASSSKNQQMKDDIASKVLALAEQDDDAIDLNFASIAKRMRSNLSDEEQEDLMEEINLLVSRHFKAARNRKKTQGAVCATSVPSCTNSNNRPVDMMQQSVMPALQRMPEQQQQQQQPQPATFFDSLSNNTYYSY